MKSHTVLNIVTFKLNNKRLYSKFIALSHWNKRMAETNPKLWKILLRQKTPEKLNNRWLANAALPNYLNNANHLHLISTLF